MAHFINCSSCGKQYNDQVFDKCPHCGFNPSMGKKEEIKSEKDGEKLKTPELSGWYSFATAIMVIESIAVVILLVVTLFSDYSNWYLFLIVLGVYLFELAFLSIIQLLAGIKLGIEKLVNNNENAM